MATKSIAPTAAVKLNKATSAAPSLYRMWGSKVNEKAGITYCIPKMTEPCITCCVTREKDL